MSPNFSNAAVTMFGNQIQLAAAHQDAVEIAAASFLSASLANQMPQHQLNSMMSSHP